MDVEKKIQQQNAAMQCGKTLKITQEYFLNTSDA